MDFELEDVNWVPSAPAAPQVSKTSLVETRDTDFTSTDTRETSDNLAKEGSAQPKGSSEQDEKPQHLRWIYDAEIRALRRRLGPLSQILRENGWNQRALAQLALVDPATVHRWLKNEDKVPGIFWRLLDLHLTLNCAPEADPLRHLRRRVQELELQALGPSTKERSAEVTQALFRQPTPPNWVLAVLGGAAGAAFVLLTQWWMGL